MATAHGRLARAGHRRDVQGLRAVAVLVVVAFHAGLPVPGGFVGVDVFFVVSGFVITAMLQREWDTTGRIRLGRFYLRRFKRLAPALALVVAFTVVGATVTLSPLGPQQHTATTALGAMLGSANLVITQVSGGYFDTPAAANPLLHTWSLSVEEQFYLVFPLLLLLGWMSSRRWPLLRAATAFLVLLVALVSFGLTVFALDNALGPVTESLIGFYGPLSRAWEFAAGALLALGSARVAGTSRRTARAAGWAGVGLLVLSLLAISESTPFPGPWTLLPVAGTVLVLVGGAGEGGLVARLLSSGPMVRIGDWSYSIYLWHWPLIVFARVMWPGDDGAVVAVAVLSLAPAVASYRLVEMPLRRRPSLDRPAVLRLVALVVTPALAVSALVLYVSTTVWGPGLESGTKPAYYSGEVDWSDHDYRQGGYQPCTSESLRTLVERAVDYETRCQQSRPGADVDLALIGDSHVEHLFIGLAETLPERNIMYFTTDDVPSMANPQYAAAVHYVESTPTIDTVLVTSSWAARGVAEPDLARLLSALEGGGRSVLLTDDVPRFAFSPFGCKYRISALVPVTCSENEAVIAHEQEPVSRQLARVARRVPGVQLLRTAHYLCDGRRCSMTRGHDILYADTSHLNVLGSRYVAGRMVSDYGVLSSSRHG